MHYRKYKLHPFSDLWELRARITCSCPITLSRSNDLNFSVYAIWVFPSHSPPTSTSIVYHPSTMHFWTDSFLYLWLSMRSPFTHDSHNSWSGNVGCCAVCTFSAKSPFRNHRNCVLISPSSVAHFSNHFKHLIVYLSTSSVFLMCTFVISISHIFHVFQRS